MQLVLDNNSNNKVHLCHKNNGNVFLDFLHGATAEVRPGGVDMNAELAAAAERFRQEGRTPYAIPGGGSNATGALGYVNCAFELVGQANDRDRESNRRGHDGPSQF